ncbi:MAG: glycosyltransferase family 4 protein [Dechloromonas sp.]|nr:glycosyltransferase family 4 protein [Dechloromonas sp.]
MKKLVYVTNIPTPYRIPRFNELAAQLRKQGWHFEVLFTSDIEPNRSWVIDYDSIKFDYKIYWGLRPTLFGMFAHFNPGLLARLARDDYDIVVIGGYGNPTLMFAPFFCTKRALKIISIESNLDSVKRTSGFAARLKELILKKADAFQVTGHRQKEYIKYFIGGHDKNFVVLPNLINECNFHRVAASAKSRLRAEYAFGLNDKIWLLPARLSPEKGILQFLEAFKSVENVKLLICGDGPLKLEIQDYVSKENIDVKLIGFVQESAMADYYNMADVFVLPSISDPSPLSPIEALRSGLPLLISNRVGNLDEVYSINNGFVFDILDANSVLNAVSCMAKALPNQLDDMGDCSEVIYSQRFDTKKVISEYLISIDDAYFKFKG